MRRRRPEDGADSPPAAPCAATLAAAIIARRAQRDDELQDLRALLLEHGAPALRRDGRLADLADTVALACLGDNHLWQDLQLGSRAELSALMRHWFPALVAKNHADMKWKKFFYKQLCERAALHMCRAPSCSVCVDHATCFGPET
jgi:nitrogen fixation protein NifQ